MAVHPTTRPTGQQDIVRELTPVSHRVRPREIADSWDVAKILAVRDLKTRYKQSILGPAWLVLQPLGVLVGLTFVFSGVTNVDTGDIPYTVFALGSISPWTFFQLCVSLGTVVFIMNNGLIRRVAFPRTALFTAIGLGNLVPAGIILAVALVALLVTVGLPPVQILLLPLVGLWLAALSAGVMMLMASLTVRFRDVMAFVPFFLQIGLFITPVGYPLYNAPEHIQTLLSLNPLSGVLEVWRWCLFGSTVSSLALAVAVVGSIAIVFVGWWTYVRSEISFADYI